MCWRCHSLSVCELWELWELQDCMTDVTGNIRWFEVFLWFDFIDLFRKSFCRSKDMTSCSHKCIQITGGVDEMFVGWPPLRCHRWDRRRFGPLPAWIVTVQFSVNELPVLLEGTKGYLGNSNVTSIPPQDLSKMNIIDSMKKLNEMHAAWV